MQYNNLIPTFLHKILYQKSHETRYENRKMRMISNDMVVFGFQML